MSKDDPNYHEGDFEVTILFKSKESVSFNCESFRILDVDKFLYAFDGLSDDDGIIIHHNYDPTGVDNILINDVGEEDEEEDGED